MASILAQAYIASALAAAICLACAANPTTRATLSCIIIACQILLQLTVLPDLRGAGATADRTRYLPHWLEPSRRTDPLFRDADCAFIAVGKTLEN